MLLKFCVLSGFFYLFRVLNIKILTL